MAAQFLGKVSRRGAMGGTENENVSGIYWSRKWRRHFRLVWPISVCLLGFAAIGCKAKPKLKDVRLGMSQEKLIELAGEPKQKLADPRSHKEIWVYPAFFGAATSPQVMFDARTGLVVAVILND